MVDDANCEFWNRNDGTSESEGTELMKPKKGKRPLSERLTVSFWPEQRQALQEIAEANHVPLNYVVCSAVQELIDENQGKRLRLKLSAEK